MKSHLGKLDIDLSSLESESDDDNEGEVSSKLKELLRDDDISETNESSLKNHPRH